MSNPNRFERQILNATSQTQVPRNKNKYASDPWPDYPGNQLKRRCPGSNQFR